MSIGEDFIDAMRELGLDEEIEDATRDELTSLRAEVERLRMQLARATQGSDDPARAWREAERLRAKGEALAKAGSIFLASHRMGGEWTWSVVDSLAFRAALAEWEKP